MTSLHYQVSQCGHLWVVSCEDIPIEAFDDRKDALSAASRLVNVARHRGNHVQLQIGQVRPKSDDHKAELRKEKLEHSDVLHSSP